MDHAIEEVQSARRMISTTITDSSELNVFDEVKKSGFIFISKHSFFFLPTFYCLCRGKWLETPHQVCSKYSCDANGKANGTTHKQHTHTHTHIHTYTHTHTHSLTYSLAHIHLITHSLTRVFCVVWCVLFFSKRNFQRTVTCIWKTYPTGALIF